MGPRLWSSDDWEMGKTVQCDFWTIIKMILLAVCDLEGQIIIGLPGLKPWLTV